MKYICKKLSNKEITTTRPARRRAFQTKKFVMLTETVNNSCSQVYSQRRCHAQHNVKPAAHESNLLS